MERNGGTPTDDLDIKLEKPSPSELHEVAREGSD